MVIIVKNRGFTLVELLGVIIILALLSLVMFPNIISSFFDVSNKLDDATKLLVTEAAKDYYAENRDYIENLDYCVTVSNLQTAGLLSYDIKDSDGKVIPTDMIVKISNHGTKYEIDEKCVVSSEGIKEAARAYYNDGNITINNGESICITILTLQNSYYLSKNITDGNNAYSSNTSIKLSNNGGIIVEINESC